jgi:NADH:ubiquinone oxidoreductase subunit 5 (subunit L)/multisubunit Na+/H+ antiporter MnhA subunit
MRLRLDLDDTLNLVFSRHAFWRSTCNPQGVMNLGTVILLAPCSLLLGALLELLLSRRIRARTKGLLAALCSLPPLIASAMAVPAIQGGHALDIRLAAWDGPAALVFHVDALSVLFGAMGALLGAIVLLYSIGYMAEERSATRFFATMQVFIAGFIALVYSANLLVLYLCWEVVGLCSFSLVGFWYTHPEAVRGARKVLLTTHLAGYGLLAAILIVWHRTGTLLFTDAAAAHAFTNGVFLLMLVAVVAKSVQVPLHTWIPDAMAAPTPVSALLHAACYVKAGVYLAARMYSFGTMPPLAGSVMVWIGTVTMLVGVMYAMVQTDLKRMLAFHTVSQIGYMITGIGIGTPLGILAGLLHCLNHAFFKGGLFLAAGSVQHATGSRNMDELGGLAQRMPRTTMAWMATAGGIMGIPLMSGFASKWLLYTAALQSGWIVPALIAWVVSLGTVFSFMKATSSVFLGDTTAKTEHAHEAPLTMQLGLGSIAGGSLLLGVAPQIVVRFLLAPVLATLGMGEGLRVTWFGMASGAGAFPVAEGLVLVVVSLVVGGLIYMLAAASRTTVASGGAALAAAGSGVFTGGELMPGDGRLPAHEFSAMIQENWRAFFRWSNVDRLWAWIGDRLNTTAGRLNQLSLWLERRALALLLAASAALLIGVKFAGYSAVAPSPRAVSAPLFLLIACALALAALLTAAWVQPQWRRFTPSMALAGLLSIAGLAASHAAYRLALLEAAAAVAIFLVAQAARTRSARLTYLAVFLISAAAIMGSHFAADHSSFAWARALFFTGVVVKLAAVPLFFWLLRLADELPALALGLLIAVLDIAVFGEVVVTAQASPWLLTPRGLWLTVAAASAFGGALLMLAQRDLKRLLVLSTVEDIGFLLLGVSSASALGYQGALAGAAAHALAKALLFASLSAPEAAGALAEPRGLAARFPVSGAAFLFGMLAMLGVPPTLGYLGRWRLYDVALEADPRLLALFLASSALALIAYVAALARCWWGPPPDTTPPPRENALLRFAMVALIAVLLLTGLWPSLIGHWSLDPPLSAALSLLRSLP